MKFAFVCCYEWAIVVNSCDRQYWVFFLLVVLGSRNHGYCAHEIVDNFPDLAHISADADHELAVFRITKTRDSLLVVMLGMHVVEKLSLVQLYNIEDFLSLFE